MINLGSLYTEIVADTTGLNKSASIITKFSSTAAGTFKAVVGAAAAVTASITGIGTAAGIMISSVAKQTQELSVLANQAGTTAGELQAYSFATETVGVNAEKLSDISKDVFDKLGDYIATGGGEFKDFFENIAPKVGLTAEQLKKMSGPEALGAIKNAMDQANVSYKEQVFYMEAIANDASRLIPLLAEDGKKMKEMSDRARDLGVALSQVQVDQLNKAALATRELSTVFDVLKTKVAAALAPIYTAITNYLIKGMQEFNKNVSSEAITRWAKESSIAVLQFSIDFLQGFESVYRFLNKVIGILNLSYAGALKLGQGFQWLFEQSNRMFGDDEKAEYWANAQKDAAELIEGALKSANDAFNRSDAGIKWTEKATKKINELKQQIENIDENAINKEINKPLEKVNGTTEELYKNFEGIWTNGGKQAQTNLGNIQRDMDDIALTAEQIEQTIANWDSDKINSANASRRMFGGIISRMKKGGEVFKAQAGRFFPGFGGGDKIPILGEAGEYMINKFAVRDAGVDTARAFNQKNWAKVVSNLSKKMSIGGPVSTPFSGPALAMSTGGGVSSVNIRSNETVRNYYIQGSSTPISVRADEKNAARMLAALRRTYMSKGL